MPTLAELLADLDRLAPQAWALPGDRSGHQIGEPGLAVRGIAVALDHTGDLLDFAAARGANVLVCHHPLIWAPLPDLREVDPTRREVAEILRRGWAFVGMHTNWDCAPGGVNDALAGLLGLEVVGEFGPCAETAQSKLFVTAPEACVPDLLEALAEVGAGVIGAYSHCSFQIGGLGTFRGGEGANPAIGQAGRLERVAEVRLEMVVPSGLEAAARAAIRRTHPYEEPAVDFVTTSPRRGPALGRTGTLPEVESPEQFRARVEAALGAAAQVWSGGRPIRRVAVVGGAGASEWSPGLGVDAFVTGEVPQHLGVLAAESGVTMVQAGHYATEQPGVEALAAGLAERGWPVDLFVPDPGRAGRPL